MLASADVLRATPVTRSAACRSYFGDSSSFNDDPAKRSFRVMNAQEFTHIQRCFPMVFQQGEQFRAGIDAARGSTGFDQAVPSVIIGAKEDRFLQRIGVHPDKGQAKQRQECGLVCFEDLGKLCRTRPSRLKRQRVWRFKAEL